MNPNRRRSRRRVTATSSYVLPNLAETSYAGDSVANFSGPNVPQSADTLGDLIAALNSIIATPGNDVVAIAGRGIDQYPAFVSAAACL
jgi:hypothetical protein